GAHMTLVPRILDLLAENEADDVLVVVGGTIPTEDAGELKRRGVAEVFTPGAPTSAIVDYLASNAATQGRARGRARPRVRRFRRLRPFPTTSRFCMSIELRCDERVALITVNRPDALNALSSALLEELDSTLTHIARDPEVGCVVLTGAGERAFIAGADIAEMATKTPLEARSYAELGQDVARRLETMRKPTIAAVNGFALGGGCEMALACDVRFASSNARFGQPEITLGLIPGW